MTQYIVTVQPIRWEITVTREDGKVISRETDWTNEGLANERANHLRAVAAEIEQYPRYDETGRKSN